jgi:hypothetical protein
VKESARIVGKAAIWSPFFFCGLAVALAAASPPPPVIEWLDGAVVGGLVDLLWMPAQGVSRYRVYMEGERVGEVGDYSFSMPAPAKPGSYSFEVAAVDDAGDEGPRSPAARVGVAAFPSPPTHFVPRPEIFGPKVRLRWGGVLGAASYQLYRGVGREGPLVPLAAVSGCTFIDTRVKYSRNYRYAVTPLDADGREGQRSQPVMVTTPTPGPC